MFLLPHFMLLSERKMQIVMVVIMQRDYYEASAVQEHSCFQI